MIREYSLMIEGEGASFSAHVPEPPAILVTGTSVEDLKSRAAEAIQLYLEHRAGEDPDRLRRRRAHG